MSRFIKTGIDKIGITGSWFAAAACPICFPKIAAIGAIFGMGALAPFEIYFFWGAQVFVLLTVVGQIVAYRRLKNQTLLFFSMISASLFFISLYMLVSEMLSYVALAGIALGGIWMLIADRRVSACQVKVASREL